MNVPQRRYTRAMRHPGACGHARAWAHASAIALAGATSVVGDTVMAAPPQPTVEVVWRGPPGCPTTSAFREQVSRHLGQPLATPRSQSLRARAHVEGAAAAWTLTLTIHTPDGDSSSRVVGTDCTTLADVAALKIAMAIDPLSVLERLGEVESAASPSPEPESAPPPAPDEEVADPGPPPPASGPRTPMRLGLRTLSGVAWGAMPRLDATFSWAGSVIGRAWRVDLGGAFWVPQNVTLAEDGAGGRMRQLGGYADGCWVPAIRRFAFPLCGGLEFSSMRGEGVGVDPAGSARRLWAAVRVNAALLWSPHPLVALVLQPGVAAPYLRPRFGLADGRSVHRARALDVRVAAGLEVRFRVPGKKPDPG